MRAAAGPVGGRDVFPVITVRRATVADGAVFVASGPDGHEALLARTTEDSARRDGLAYFLSTREYVDGRWVLR